MAETSAIARRIELVERVDTKIFLSQMNPLEIIHHLARDFPVLCPKTEDERRMEKFLLDGCSEAGLYIKDWVALRASVTELFNEWRAVCADFPKLPREYRDDVVKNDVVDHFLKVKNTRGIELARQIAGPYILKEAAQPVEFDAHEIRLIVSLSPFLHQLCDLKVEIDPSEKLYRVAVASGFQLATTAHGSKFVVTFAEMVAAYLKLCNEFAQSDAHANAGLLPVNAALLAEQ